MKYRRHPLAGKIMFLIACIIALWMFCQTCMYLSHPSKHEFWISPSLIEMDKTSISPKEVSIRVDSNTIVIHTFGSIHLRENDLTNYEDYKDYRAPFAFDLTLRYDEFFNHHDLNLEESNFVKIIDNETGASVKKPVESRKPDELGIKFVSYFYYNEIPKYDGDFEILLNLKSAELDDYVLINLDSQFSISNSGECMFFLTIPEDYNFKYVKANSYDIHIEEIGDTKIISTSFVNVSENPIEIHIRKCMIDPTIFYGSTGVGITISLYLSRRWSGSRSTNNVSTNEAKKESQYGGVTSENYYFIFNFE